MKSLKELSEAYKGNPARAGIEAAKADDKRREELRNKKKLSKEEEEELKGLEGRLDEAFDWEEYDETDIAGPSIDMLVQELTDDLDE